MGMGPSSCANSLSIPLKSRPYTKKYKSWLFGSGRGLTHMLALSQIAERLSSSK